MNIFERGQNTMNRLAGKYGTELIYIKPGETTGPEFNPVIGPPTRHKCKGFKVRGPVFSEYLSNGFIQKTDTLLSVEVFDETPAMDGKIEIGGVENQIIYFDKASFEPGVPVFWMIGCRR